MMGADITIAFFAIMALTAVVVIACVFIHYEFLYGLYRLLPRLHFLPKRMKLMVVIVGVFIAHTLEVWVFALAFMVATHLLGLGYLGGTIELGNTWIEIVDDYVYFSMVTYTSLGLGDIHPVGPIRLMVGVEALVGLILVGWSASFTYLMMEKYWNKQH
jgi:hypothetical protein